MDDIAAEDHSRIATEAERTRRDNTWVHVLNSSGPNNDDTKNLATLTQDFVPMSKFDSDQVNHSLGKMKDLSESTPKLDGDGTLLQPHQAHRRRGNHLKNGCRRGIGMNSACSFSSQCQGVSLTGNGDSFVSDGWCKHNTKPTQTSQSRTRYFSRLAQDLSHRVRNRCVSQNSRSSHPAQHVARAVVVVTFTFEHYFTFHMNPYATFFRTFHPTFIDVYFTLRFILHRSIECVFRSSG